MRREWLYHIAGLWAVLCRRYYATSKPNRLIFLGLIFLLAAAPPAATRLPNQATATYFNTSLGFHETLYSNTVNIDILPQEALTLTQDQTVRRAPGARINLPHLLTNSGNTPLTATVKVTNIRNDDYDLSGLAVFRDTNGNGVADPFERPLAPDQRLPLNPNESVNLVVSGTAPATAAIGQSASIILTATSTGQGVQTQNTDTIIIVDGAVIEISKSGFPLQPRPNDIAIFTLSATNSGNKIATGTPAVIDGTPTTLLVLRDEIPANTTFVRIDNTDASTPLYHRRGAPANHYTTTPPTDLTQVDAVGRGLTSLPPGQSLPLQFTVTIHPNAAGSIVNTAYTDYHNGTEVFRANSNIVELPLPSSSPTLHFFTDKSFETTAAVLTLGSPLFVEADAAACNQNSTTIETHIITITADLTGDIELFPATETGPNSGIFRIDPPPETRDSTVHPAQPGNAVIETQTNDQLTARLEGCGAAFVETVVLIDPFGLVFDSRTNTPIEGATITLLDVTGQGLTRQADSPASVFQADGVTPAPSTVVTTALGTYEFPLVRSSTYRLEVTPPPGYTFPSTLASNLLPPGRFTDTQGSYGGTFIVDISGPVRIDIPVDRSTTGALFVEKKASKSIVELGDFVNYTVEVKNTSEVPLLRITLTDTLPSGFTLQPGTTRLNRQPIPEPEGSPGPRLTIPLDRLAPNTTATLTYRVRVGPGALSGDGTNRAQAQTPGPLPVQSNVASATVEVRGGIFDGRSFIVGKVFADCNANRLQDDAEPGVPGVRLYLENGTFAITDTAGKYNFFGITPRTHVVKVDRTTLPAGTPLIPLSVRHGGQATSRFADLKKHELHKADFAVGSCAPQLLKAIEARREHLQTLVVETERKLKTELRPQGEQELTLDPRAQPSSGYLQNDLERPSFSVDSNPISRATPQRQTQPTPSTKPSPPSAQRGIHTTDFSSIVSQLDATLGIINLRDGETLPYPQTNIQVKGRLGATFTLAVNGVDIPTTRIGQKQTFADQQLQIWEYISINLEAGTNVLELRQLDPFGNVRAHQTVTVIAPDKLGAIRIEVPDERLQADASTPVGIEVILEDPHGIPVTVRTPIMLEASDGRWQATDLRPDEPGIHVFIEGGKGTFFLLPPTTPGDVQIRVSSGTFQEQTTVSFLPKLRPLLAVGVIEGILNVHDFSTANLTPVREQDSFERELRNLTFNEANGQLQGGGRAAFFLKGTIKGDYLLTMAYDSDKETEERLFRDIQPDRFYPVYGDSSIRGFDAQSTGRLYVRVDKDKSYLLYGDFTTQERQGAVKHLGRYNRSLTGAKLHYENKRISVEAFGSRDNTHQVIDEIPGRGISGPYELSTPNILENSEQVELLIRDRSQPSLVLERISQTRFEDYEIDALSGHLLFRAPVPSLDPNLNPIVIRVTYEVQSGGDDFWVAGAQGQVRVTDVFEVGGSYTRDENPGDKRQIISGNTTLKLPGNTYVIGEVAQTDSDREGQGIGWRTEVRHRSQRFEARAEVLRTSPDFDNPSAASSPGRFEIRGKGTYKLTPKTHIIGEALHSEDTATDGKRDGGDLTVRHTIGRNIFGELGVRHSRETTMASEPRTDGVTPYDSTSLRAKLGAQVPYIPRLSLYGEYEQDIFHDDRRVAAVGGEYQVFRRGRVYARHEFISSLAGRFSLNSNQSRHVTLIGADVDYIRNGQLFSEYRVRDAIDGRDAQAAIGLRHRFRLATGWHLNAGLERIQTIDGPSETDSTAVTSALTYTAHPRWKGTARLEVRENRGSTSLLNTLGLAYALHRNWTFLGKHTLTWSKDAVRERLRIGAAFRDTDTNVWNALLRYEFRYENDKMAMSNYQIHILATHLNYQPIRPLILSGYLASKWVIDNSDGLRSASNTHLLSSRLTYDITDRLDIGFMGSALFSGDLHRVDYGLGAEMGFLVADNLWLSFGYNVFGFHEDHLGGTSYTNPGIFLRFRYKFDEQLLHQTANTFRHTQSP